MRAHFHGEFGRIRAVRMAAAGEMLTELRQARSMAAGLLIDSREAVTLTLPGRATAVTGFTELDGNLYRVAIEGEEILDAMGAIVDAGPERLAARMREAADQGISEGELFASLVAEHLPQLPARIEFEPSSGAAPCWSLPRACP